MSIIPTINFPLEVGTIDADCTICYDELKWPVFCPRCKHGNCFRCLENWYNQKQECPVCRHVFQITEAEELRKRYGCPMDGNVVYYYCEQCLECFCEKCRVNPTNGHFRHAVRKVDILRKEIMQSVELLTEKKINGDIVKNSLVQIKTIMPKGSPHELVRQRRVLQSILDRLKKAVPPEMFEKIIKLTNTKAEKQIFSATDHAKNVWELTVYPNGFSDAVGKFISLYLKLVQGIPARYEYCFKILDKNGREAIETYSAVDDFAIGGQSLACQRLIHVNEAFSNCLTAGGYNMAFSVKPTNPKYAEDCVAALLRNKLLHLDYDTFSWTLKNFAAKKYANKIEFSPIKFDRQKISWRLRIDCNGHWEQGLYLSVFLELLNGAKGWFDVFIKIFNPMNPAEQHRRELTHEFTVHSNWGVPHFVSHAELYRYLQNDELRFEFGMRPAHFDFDR